MPKHRFHAVISVLINPPVAQQLPKSYLAIKVLEEGKALKIDAQQCRGDLVVSIQH